MSTPFIGEIRLTPYNFFMNGWASCDGQLLPISQNNALFALIGTTYGGDGQTTFALPNLKSRIPVGQGNPPAGGSYQVGQVGGSETVILNASHLPAHTHQAVAVSLPSVGTTASPTNAGWAGSALSAYSANATPPLVPMAASALGSAGSAQPQPHENRMPFLALNFQISLFGIFPSRS